MFEISRVGTDKSQSLEQVRTSQGQVKRSLEKYITSSGDKRGGKKRRGGVGSVMKALDRLNRELWLPIGGGGLHSFIVRWNKRSIEF